MITLSVLMLFGLGAVMFSIAAGIISFGFNVLGHVLNGVFSILGFLLMPFALVLAVAFGIGYLLPILIPVGLVLLLVGAARPRIA